MDVEDSESKDSGGSATGTGKKGAVEPSTKTRKNWYIHSPWLHIYLYSVTCRVGTKGTDATHAAHEKGKGHTHIPFCLED
uniref:Uncharacterized protein n=1 Tax=Tanacetum cinerariifolium TaxID=118510 RepID=A0A699KJ93_TANCI|nr:hypothetical protein [Tanacetum cinerariifolium]